MNTNRNPSFLQQEREELLHQDARLLDNPLDLPEDKNLSQSQDLLGSTLMRSAFIPSFQLRDEFRETKKALQKPKHQIQETIVVATPPEEKLDCCTWFSRKLRENFSCFFRTKPPTKMVKPENPSINLVKVNIT